MELQLWIWIIIGLTFSIYIGIAIWSKAGSTKDFYVAFPLYIYQNTFKTQVFIEILQGFGRRTILRDLRKCM